MKYQYKLPFCDENPIDCHFDVKNHIAGQIVRNDDTNTNYLIFCRTGHAWISSTLVRAATSNSLMQRTMPE